MDAAGAMAHLFSPQGRVDPYPAYERLRAHGPVVEIAPGLYVATGYTAIDEVLRDPRYEVTHEELTQHPVAAGTARPST
ncbi:hypothetical protein GA0074694_5453 [Micromonospora inyonensis]|uniref:Uncharacterized protein n=1 Tax=Micromonospora inyonensis TaxID=47866 RepID=A0A1C6SJQ6_9ACTN|nr:hypothetical protein GA0074694_5453 [Micromonospora inyonensis]